MNGPNNFFHNNGSGRNVPSFCISMSNSSNGKTNSSEFFTQWPEPLGNLLACSLRAYVGYLGFPTSRGTIGAILEREIDTLRQPYHQEFEWLGILLGMNQNAPASNKV
ncbi:hypothetical protein [Brevibacillus antibioticus]|uniref:hypothetical protein n=1 Tax=Brevibacillus antibioticus TaxID=2570228 RepID=UPI0013905BEF|nr:hypothetical protein [Brevibacillus antibioticus]